jgi:sugar/nucleoside kinase (ribokinase family)
MALFEPRKRPLDIPVSRSHDIVDVTGAGDTVIATYTLGLPGGVPFGEIDSCQQPMSNRAVASNKASEALIPPDRALFPASLVLVVHSLSLVTMK